MSAEMSQREHIRYRAGMYIGRLGDGTYPNDGIYTLLQEVLHHVANEYWEGHGKRIEVRMEDKQTITIRDYGRGMSFEERYADSCHSPRMMIELLTCLGMDTVNALSSCLDMCIYRNGSVAEFHYEEGMLLGEWKKKTKRKDGISVSFTPDENIFGNFRFKEDIVFSMLRELSYLNVGLEIIYGKVSMKSTNGMAELLADRMVYEGEYLYPIIHFKDESLDVAFTHSCEEGKEWYSFVNGLYTRRGGTHLQAFKKAIASVMLELYPSDEFIPEDVCSGMVGAMSLTMQHPLFEQATKWKLGVMYIDEDKSCTMKEYMQSFLGEKLKAHLQVHPEVCRIIYERMSGSKNKRKLC